MQNGIIAMILLLVVFDITNTVVVIAKGMDQQQKKRANWIMNNQIENHYLPHDPVHVIVKKIGYVCHATFCYFDYCYKLFINTNSY